MPPAPHDRPGSNPHLDAEAYLARAEECARLAGLAMDRMIQRRLQELHQEYLGIARRLDRDQGYFREALTLVIRAPEGLLPGRLLPRVESSASRGSATA